jgi:predicted outer membrane protein
MKRTLMALLLAAACAAPALAQTSAPSGTMVSPADESFLKQAIIAGEQEVADAQTQLSNSNPYVKKFASRMITDHTKANQQLMTLARKDGVAHEQAVALFQKEAQHGTGAAKALAAQILPTLEQHLAMAQQFAKTGKISTSGSPQ